MSWLPTDALAFPAYSYVPGGPYPHPRRGKPAGEGIIVVPIEGGDWAASTAYVHAFALFDAGYYWESHEVWEALWHAHGRKGPIADLLRAMIKLAAAGVKVREGQPRGVATHARNASAILARLEASEGPRLLGLDLARCRGVADSLAKEPPADPGRRDDPVARVFDFVLAPR